MPTPANVLIVTQMFDPHADCMVHLLQKMGHQPIRLHTADIPQMETLSFYLTNEGLRGGFYANGRQIELQDIHTIWWRRPGRFQLPPDLPEGERVFANLELTAALGGIWDALDCYWISRPHHIRLASYKPGQLKRAASLGFEVPRTLITTNPLHVQEFYEACCGQVIYKVLSDPTLGFTVRAEEMMKECVVEQGPGLDPIIDWKRAKARITYTTVMQKDHLEMLEAVRLAPCQFQEYVPKQLELRVTIIGDEIFVAEILSQTHERTQHDWRHYDVNVPYRKGSLPIEVAERCYQITKSYGLEYGAIDLILTPDGRYVFLEINPNGQWLWLQQLVPELKLKEAMATRLIQGHRLVVA